MNFRTEITGEEYPFRIRHDDKIMLLGSCFSDNIGQKFKYFGFNSVYNPFGIVYNPFSICSQISMMAEKKYPSPKEFEYRDDLWHHFDFHGDMSDPDMEAAVFKCRKVIDSGHDFLKKAGFLFLTFGTSVVYKLKSNGRIVANNHKFPSSHFDRAVLKTEDIVELMQSCMEEILDFNPAAIIILSISPVRHYRDGLIENQRSKARLIQATEELEDRERIFYFPSYEIFMDDLRDYRFYGPDMLHPSDTGVQYVWEKLSELVFDNETLSLNIKIDKLSRSVRHRPMFPDTKSHAQFRSRLTDEILDFQKKHPAVRLDIPDTF